MASSGDSFDQYEQKAYRCRSGIFWDYILTENEILSIKVVSRNFVLVLAIASAAFIFLFISTIAGVIEGFIVYVMFVILASSRRNSLSRFTPEELISQNKFAQRIPWSDVSRAELNGKRFSLVIAGKKVVMKLETVVDETKLKKFLATKLSDKLVFK